MLLQCSQRKGTLTMLSFGFEREFFLQKDGTFCLVPAHIPKDACGYLAEARGEPSESLLRAVGNLLASEQSLQASAEASKLALVALDTVRLPAALVMEALQTHGKPPVPVVRGSMYGR